MAETIPSAVRSMPFPTLHAQRRHFAWLLLAACGCASPQIKAMANDPASPPAEPASSPEPAAALPSSGMLHRAELGRSLVWVEPGGERFVDTDDACCGVAYQGNKYDDRIATCAVDTNAQTECAPGYAGVYPGLAADSVCGERRRCAPLAQVRVIAVNPVGVRAGSHDSDEITIARSLEEARFEPFNPGRQGMIQIGIARGSNEHVELVALDHGLSYTIYVGDMGVTRVVREAPPASSSVL
ncbi:MAG: hypothetical protein HOW73_38190 [Polyangiaceae bacterium]|nr:hypothetical protein [Polyangiaceae bacterium]